MLSKEANDRLTRVGPGTPMGDLLRRYWHPISTAFQLEKEPVQAVKILGESLALYKAPDGTLGLMAERCPHRGASMAYGIPENDGLRCPYHGWIFDAAGACVDIPAEPTESTFKHRVRTPAYPVQEMGGLIWAYLGPAPAPVLPRFDLFVREDLHREIGVTLLPCNWLQVMENSLDPYHLEWLHLVYTNYVLERQGKPGNIALRKHAKVAFDVFEHGVSKRRLWEGEDEEGSDEWKIGHPILFPTILAVGASTRPQFQIRVPVDDVTTLHFWYETRVMAEGESLEPMRVYDYPYCHENGRYIVETISGQDMMVWITQGVISDRTTERLGSSDKGVILYRTLLLDGMEKVARGEDPLGVIRDSALEGEAIYLPREGAITARQQFAASGANSELFAIRKEA
jgi:5,5'-dehydrodivanillate O-demethylase